MDASRGYVDCFVQHMAVRGATRSTVVHCSDSQLTKNGKLIFKIYLFRYLNYYCIAVVNNLYLYY